MSTIIAESKTFEEKMKERIKDSIGDLITDEDLGKMVTRGVEEAFFNERSTGNSYNSTKKPPLIHEIVRELLEPTVRNAVDEHLRKNVSQIKDAVDKVVSDGIGQAVVNAVSNQFSSQLSNFQSNMEQTFYNNNNNY